MKIIGIQCNVISWEDHAPTYFETWKSRVQILVDPWSKINKMRVAEHSNGWYISGNRNNFIVIWVSDWPRSLARCSSNKNLEERDSVFPRKLCFIGVQNKIHPIRQFKKINVENRINSQFLGDTYFWNTLYFWFSNYIIIQQRI